jgi:hypothetical protein
MFFVALTVQLEDLQLAGNTAATNVNVVGETVVERVENIYARVHEVALHRVRHDAALGFTVAQVYTVQNLHGLNVALPEEDEEIEAITDDFEPATETIANGTSSADVVNRVFM